MVGDEEVEEVADVEVEDVEMGGREEEDILRLSDGGGEADGSIIVTSRKAESNNRGGSTQRSFEERHLAKAQH